jgi:hypothetical protein
MSEQRRKGLDPVAIADRVEDDDGGRLEGEPLTA